jgi:hypothetical protein
MPRPLDTSSEPSLLPWEWAFALFAGRPLLVLAPGPVDELPAPLVQMWAAATQVGVPLFVAAAAPEVWGANRTWSGAQFPARPDAFSRPSFLRWAAVLAPDLPLAALASLVADAGPAGALRAAPETWQCEFHRALAMAEFPSPDGLRLDAGAGAIGVRARGDEDRPGILGLLGAVASVQEDGSRTGPQRLVLDASAWALLGPAGRQAWQEPLVDAALSPRVLVVTATGWRDLPDDSASFWLQDDALILVSPHLPPHACPPGWPDGRGAWVIGTAGQPAFVHHPR